MGNEKTYKTWEGPAPFAIASHRIASKVPFVLFASYYYSQRERNTESRTDRALSLEERERVVASSCD